MSSLRHWVWGTIVLLCCLHVQGEEECEPGKYGDGCSQNCSESCIVVSNKVVSCHKVSGKCLEGCKEGMYGDNCNYQCSRNCKNNTCDQQTAHCIWGCTGTHIGDFCETSQQITTLHQDTTYSSRTTVATGVTPASNSNIIIPVLITVLVLVLVGAVSLLLCVITPVVVAVSVLVLVIFIVVAVIVISYKRRRRSGARVPVQEEMGLSPDARDPTEAGENLLPDARDCNEVGESLFPENVIVQGTKDHAGAGSPNVSGTTYNRGSGSRGPDEEKEREPLQAREPKKEEEVLRQVARDTNEEKERLIPDERDACDTKTADQEIDPEDESTDNDSDDSGQQVKCIKDFATDPREQDVTLHVKVIRVGQVVEKSNKKQFMATVADDTSAVDICVREEKLFDKFEQGKCIILRNVTWNGKVIFTKSSSTATYAALIRAPENITANALGEGDPVPIFNVLKLEDRTKISLTGKIVKQSRLIKRKCYGKVLSYRQVKLKDDTGSVNVDVWGGIAEQMQLDTVFKINSCRKRKPQKTHQPWVTTTPKSTVTALPSSELGHIQKAHRYQRGTLVGIDVTPYMSCPKPGCFYFQLTDGRCESCEYLIPEQEQVTYGEANIDIRTQKGQNQPLTVYWPQLRQLFKLFQKTEPGRDQGKIVTTFQDILNKTVKYQACGIVSKFKL